MNTPQATMALNSAEAAEFFVRPGSFRHLEPFMQSECTLSEAGKRLGLSNSHMSYWLNKLLGLGLIELVRIERRGRHRVPLYRAVAHKFTVPLDKLPVESDEQILQSLNKGFEEAAWRAVMRLIRQHDQVWNMEYHLVDGKARLELAPHSNPKGEIPMVIAFGSIHLSADMAQAARNDLRSLMDHYNQNQVPTGKRYLFQVVMVEDAPLVD